MSTAARTAAPGELDELRAENAALRRELDALRASEEHYRLMVEVNPQVPWTAGVDGGITDFNERWLRLTGLTRAEAEGGGWQRVPHPDDVPAMVAAWTRSLQTGEPYDVEHRIKLHDGSYRWMRSRADPRRDAAGAIVAWYGSTEDIHERKLAQEAVREQAAELARALQARDSFLAIASHELRTPLTPLTLKLKVLADALARGPDRARVERLRQDVEVMGRSVRRLTRQVQDLLEVSRLGMHTFTLTPENVDLAERIRELADDLAEESARAGCEVVLDLPPALPLRCDRRRVETVLEHLLRNAFKYGPDEPVNVRASVQGDRVTVAVRDRGPGIPADVVPRLFEKFERGGISEHHYGGLGLGLYLSRRIVEAHGGTIAVDTAPGRGSTFVITLPLVPAGEER